MESSDGESKAFLNRGLRVLVMVVVVVVVLAGQDKDREWLLTEKDKFDHEHDKDGNGVLDREEILAWVVPTNEYATVLPPPLVDTLVCSHVVCLTFGLSVSIVF
ncbi:Reticulocalbin-2 [Portunus trituberculatus]|uniref:Reticulocalbin-2 n=1 Tax=Portunus trituberculatus TaxID=210409 RepID=A0A5B7J3T7_PORTR|nr:Reticulocalbin-2 [Portunus trituberculatus]